MADASALVELLLRTPSAGPVEDVLIDEGGDLHGPRLWMHPVALTEVLLGAGDPEARSRWRHAPDFSPGVDSVRGSWRGIIP